MRILHGLNDIAGLPALLAAAQRDLGHQSTAVLHASPRGPAAGAVNLTALLEGNRITRKLRRGRVLAWLAGQYDIFHFHFHGTLLRDYRDCALLKAMGKRIVFHLHGCDIRDPRRVRLEHRVSACATCPVQCLTPVKLGLPDALRRYADAVIVSTPDLLEFVPGAHYIPNPLDMRPWDALREQTPRPTTSPQHRPFVVVHAPTDRAIKGTQHVEEAVAALRAEGMDVQLLLLEGMSREALRAACAGADVAVDQVLIGWVGLFALEMMALGKPVVAYIRPDLVDMQPTMPVVNAEPASLTDTLRALLRDETRRRDLGALGPAWVRDHHDLATINRRILDLYAELGAPQCACLATLDHNPPVGNSPMASAPPWSHLSDQSDGSHGLAGGPVC